MDLGLRNKRAVISGASRGIGRAIAEALAAEGASVAICGRTAEDVEAAADEISARHGTQAYGKAVDVGDQTSVQSWIDAAAGEFGGIDIVISNVSAGGGGRTAIADWRKSFDIDILGAVFLVEACMPHLEAAGGGAIVMMSSTAAVEVFRAPQPYNAVKAALINYAKNLSHVAAPKQIRVNTVSPGPVFVEGGPWDWQRQSNPEFYQGMLDQIPIGRMATADDVAKATLFLASPAGGVITGANLIVDGGFTRRVNF